MKPKILIVEDNILTQSVLGALFEGIDCDIMQIMNGAEVIPYLEKNKVDSIILDLELPGMSGDKIYQTLKENPEWNKIPVIPFSAHASHRNPQDVVPDSLHKLPEIVSTTQKPHDKVDINLELVRRVSEGLQIQGISLPSKMTQFLNPK